MQTIRRHAGRSDTQCPPISTMGQPSLHQACARSDSSAQPADPNVTWDEHGIDALIWADSEPWADILSPAQPVENTTASANGAVPVGDAP